jgi:Fe-S oxidoreductase
MEAGDKIYWSFSWYLIFWILFAIAFGLFAQRMSLLFRILRQGQKEERSRPSMKDRLKALLVEVFFQRCSLKTVTLHDLAGIGHMFLFWGFCLFFISYILYIGLGQGFGLSSILTGSKFDIIYSTILDIAGALVIIAIVWAAIRRYIMKPERLKINAEDGIILLLVCSLMVLHFLVEAFSHAASQVQASWPPIGSALGKLLKDKNISESVFVTFYWSFWWFHYVIILAFTIYIPRSKHLHIIMSPLNIFFLSSSPKGALKLVDPKKNNPIGVTKIQHFTWKHLIDLYSCTVCGRCHDHCPATLSGKSLDPREVILNLKKHLLLVGPELLKKGRKAKAVSANPDSEMIESVVTEEVIWECTSCYACQEVCPVNIEQMVKIIDMRRSLVERGKISPNIARALENIRSLGNPWEYPQSSRLDWTAGRSVHLIQKQKDPVEVLYWLGCTSVYDSRAQDILRAMLTIMERAGIRYAVLGTEERCCGDPARRIGDEGLFQKIARSNLELLNKYRFRKLLVHCPHCFNTFKNEYPQLGGHFEMVHHSQFLWELIKSETISLQPEEALKLTFHDPCYLGRYNDMYDPPRQILKAISKDPLIEMRLNQSKATCCGAGGGQFWIQAQKGRRIESMRFEQAQEQKARIIATACPYCTTMLDEAAKIGEPTNRIQVKDIAELLADRIKG